jgi:hypothetical protein
MRDVRYLCHASLLCDQVSLTVNGLAGVNYLER